MKTTYILALTLAALPAVGMAGGLSQPIVEPVIEAPMPTMVITPQINWTGAYAGAELGVGSFTAGGGAADGDTGIAGVHLGYRQDMGQVVLGGELSYSQDDIGVSSAGNQINNTTALKLMAGAKTGRSLIYVSGGASRANATISGVTASDNGYFGGIGMDYALNNRWTLGGEVISHRYSDFNNSGVTLNDTDLKLKVGMRF